MKYLKKLKDKFIEWLKEEITINLGLIEINANNAAILYIINILILIYCSFKLYLKLKEYIS